MKEDINNCSVIYSSSTDNIFILAIKIETTTVVSVYKPPKVAWPDSVLPNFDKPTIYIGDFNSHHHLWGYSENDGNGEKLIEWIENTDLNILHDAKQRNTFFSAR